MAIRIVAKDKSGNNSGAGVKVEVTVCSGNYQLMPVLTNADGEATIRQVPPTGYFWVFLNGKRAEPRLKFKDGETYEVTMPD